ncbi:dTMP kinase [Nonomuraea sp. NPDC050691]|uniref:dTMP kinase n=1 Tax=Nonomuraea sp. NPDC050691 TaxID=3155661 RepID=UPI0033C44689
MFIAFCGLDGSGKTTQIELLSEALRPAHSVYVTRQPTTAYRNDPLVRAYLNDEVSKAEELPALREMALYAAADRLRHLRTEIRPHLAQGDVVLTDRYVYSSYAYFLARGLDELPWLLALNKFVPAPDLVFYLDMSPEESERRILRRDGRSHKKEEVNLERMARVREMFLSRPWGVDDRFHVIDGAQPREAVAELIRKQVGCG